MRARTARCARTMSRPGKVLWTGTLPAGSRGGPAMYEVNGRQFLVVNASQTPQGGRGAAARMTGQRAYVAFALKE